MFSQPVQGWLLIPVHSKLGTVTILWSFIVWTCLSDSPANAKFLSEGDRVLCVKRVAANQTGIKNKHFRHEQVYITCAFPTYQETCLELAHPEVVKDPKVIILFISIFAAAIPNGVLRFGYFSFIIRLPETLLLAVHFQLKVRRWCSLALY